MIHPACKICLGACCESMRLPAEFVFPGEENHDNRRWFELHGKKTATGTLFETRCNALQPDGLCGIYSVRPQCCKSFAVGSLSCRWIVRERRKENAEEIFAAMKPQTKGVS